ncbi:CPBP family intramembrane metalloprotease [Meiothermus sp. Pnk-1]|nr:CPBP family intramembrane metalloprotease [Meiothermus sp. Pnk-1]
MIWLYLGILLAAEGLVAGAYPAGLALHLALALALLVHAAFAREALGRLYAALALAPLVRVVSLSIPAGLVGPTTQYAVVGLPLILASLIAARQLGYTWGEVGLSLRGIWGQIPLAALGPLLGWLERQIIQPAPLAASLELSTLIWPVLSLILFTGLSEELLFRGLMQRAAVGALGPAQGILYVALVFGTLHLGWHSFPEVLFAMAVGLALGWIVYRTGSILGAVLAHGVANVFLFIVLPVLAQ